MDVDVKTFLRFSKCFVPHYLTCVMRNDCDVVKSSLSVLREELSEAFPEVADMLTGRLRSFLQPFLDELGIDLLFDEANSARLDSIAFTKSGCLIQGKRRIIFSHYLFPGDIFVVTVDCCDCVGCVSLTMPCVKTPFMEPAYRCENFELRERKEGVRSAQISSPDIYFENMSGWDEVTLTAKNVR